MLKIWKRDAEIRLQMSARTNGTGDDNILPHCLYKTPRLDVLNTVGLPARKVISQKFSVGRRHLMGVKCFINHLLHQRPRYNVGQEFSTVPASQKMTIIT